MQKRSQSSRDAGAGYRDKPVNVRRKKQQPKNPGVDQLGITRGQNGEKGNPTHPRKIRDEGLVSH